MTYTTIRSIPGAHKLACFMAAYHPDNPLKPPLLFGGSHARL